MDHGQKRVSNVGGVIGSQDQIRSGNRCSMGRCVGLDLSGRADHWVRLKKLDHWGAALISGLGSQWQKELRPAAEERCAEASQKEDGETVQPSALEVASAESGSTSNRKTLSIQGIDGSSFHVSVEDAMTVALIC